MYKVQNAILFITFIKFDTALRVFEAIAKVQPSRLYISSDGGRNQEEQKKIENFRQILLQKINWECEVFTLFEEKNQGCKYGPYNAITWFFNHEKQGIVLEDDCLPSISFYRFCDELLEKYKNDEQINMISGWSPFELDREFQQKLKYDYYFSKYPHIWGWASWKRAWKNYDINDQELFLDIDKLHFDSKQEQRYWTKIFKTCIKKNLDAWDYPWLLAIWKKKGLCIIPKYNMIQNIGFSREDATHTKGNSRFETMELQNLQHKLKHPDQIARDIFLDQKNFNLTFLPDVNIVRYVLKGIKRVIKVFIQ